MRRWLLRSILTLLTVAAGTEAFATTFVVPPDRELIRRADAVVIGSALSSYSQLTRQDAIETVTLLSIEETIKGAVSGTINIVEPGGQLGKRATILAGVPRFEDGRRMLLLLTRTGVDRWAVSELVLGKFKFEDDINGQALLVRDEAEITGWDPDLRVHREQHRLAARFLNFVRAEARAQMTPADYWTDVAPLRLHRNPTTESTSRLVPAPAVAPFTANSYTMFISGSSGGRWAVFPSPVSWFRGTTQEPGAPGGGVTAIQAAFASWDNDCGSNVNYVYAGVDDGTHAQGLHGVDGRNTVLFERDLSAWGVGPFTCSGNSYSGTLGIGGVTSASGSNTVNGETFATTTEGDVEMNRGLANCTLLFNNGDFNSAVTHEVGHTLGFRHSDQDRASSGACTSDPSLECSSQAIMKSFISTGLNAALQTWDQHAVQAVYPGNVCAPGGCTAPAISTQPQSSTINSGSSATLTVGASGTAPLSYQWYVGSSGNTGSPIPGATGSSVTVSPTTTTSYWVRVSNSCGSANSNTATVTVNQQTCNPPAITSQPTSRTISLGSSTTLSVTATNATGYQWYRGPIVNGPAAAVGSGASITVTPYGSSQYFVVATNNCGAAFSTLATVTVTVPKLRVKYDFNGDGKSDIFFHNGSTGENKLFVMDGFVRLQNSALPTQWATNYRVAGLGDFNGDGMVDIIWRNPTNGLNAMWLMNGASVLTAVDIPAQPDLGWDVAGVGDFDGDGKADILWRNHNTGADQIWFMNGAARLSAQDVRAELLVFKIVGVGDFNGDGKSDILWRNTQNGDNAIWLMSGATLAQGSYIHAEGALQFVVTGVADFDGDGKADILWRNSQTGDNAMWLMNGFTLKAGSYIQYESLTWDIAGTGDYNGDGKADIFLRNHSTGQNAIWLMSAFSLLQGGYIQPEPNLAFQAVPTR